MLTPPIREEDHHAASQLILITLCLRFSHLVESLGSHCCAPSACVLLPEVVPSADISRSALLTFPIVACALGILFSKTILHRVFPIIQHVIMPTSHAFSMFCRELGWFGLLLHVSTVPVKIHSVRSCNPSGVMVLPIVPDHTCLVHKHPRSCAPATHLAASRELRT